MAYNTAPKSHTLVSLISPAETKVIAKNFPKVKCIATLGFC